MWMQVHKVMIIRIFSLFLIIPTSGVLTESAEPCSGRWWPLFKASEILYSEFPEHNRGVQRSFKSLGDWAYPTTIRKFRQYETKDNYNQSGGKIVQSSVKVKDFYVRPPARVNFFFDRRGKISSKQMPIVNKSHVQPLSNDIGGAPQPRHNVNHIWNHLRIMRPPPPVTEPQARRRVYLV